MHIPDGYLSPSTCAVLYAAAAPFWFVALRRVRRLLHTRMIPLLSLFAAFSFVVMMFNLPLPGGTTGHATGMGIAAIVLGPAASILALSIALAIQAVLFGDGGITALGANCFNMAVVGSLAAYTVYRVLAWRSRLGAPRRLLAAGLAGYAGINAAAFCAAVEFGIQPLLFHDAAGAPLYAPYPLHIAIPAMMAGHLTFAGIAEFIVTAGILAYLRSADPALLRRTAPDAPDAVDPDPETPPLLWPAIRKLALGLAVLLILTPLGIIAAGSAWGEWSARDFRDPEARRQMAAASGQAPPAQAPAGLERLSELWTAPLSRYAPPFIRSAPFGYFVSAAVGAGLVILLSFGGAWLLAKLRPPRAAAPFVPLRGRRRRRTFIERTARGLLRAIEQSVFAEQIAAAPGLLQRLDARVKLAGLFALIAASVAVHRMEALIGLFLIALLLALASRISLRLLATGVWAAVLAFTGAIALPAIFLTPGDAVFRGWPVTRQGLHAAEFLVLRAETAATLAALLLLSTPWTRLLRALRLLRLPVIAVVVLGMTYRYIFLLLEAARDMFDSRESRLVGVLEPEDARRLAAASAGVLLGKSLQLSGDVHMAMQARGFRGDVWLLNDLRMQTHEWLPLAAFAAVACAAVWLGQ